MVAHSKYITSKSLRTVFMFCGIWHKLIYPPLSVLIHLLHVNGCTEFLQNYANMSNSLDKQLDDLTDFKSANTFIGRYRVHRLWNYPEMIEWQYILLRTFNTDSGDGLVPLGSKS